MGQNEPTNREQPVSPETTGTNATVATNESSNGELVVSEKTTNVVTDSGSIPPQQNEEQDLGFGPWNILKKFQKKKAQTTKQTYQAKETPDIKGGFKYAGTQRNSSNFRVLNNEEVAPEQTHSKKRPINEYAGDDNQNVQATVKVRNPAAGKNKQVIHKGSNKPSSNLAKHVEKSVNKQHKVMSTVNSINKENASFLNGNQGVSLEDSRLEAKEREQKVLEYMRHMDEAK